jgi:hypothetical protein
MVHAFLKKNVHVNEDNCFLKKESRGEDIYIYRYQHDAWYDINSRTLCDYVSLSTSVTGCPGRCRLSTIKQPCSGT